MFFTLQMVFLGSLLTDCKSVGKSNGSSMWHADPGARTAMSRGYRISYEDVGQGPAVIIIPAFMQSAAEYREAGYVARLSATHRVVLVDPLGQGKSDKPRESDVYAYPAVAADVIAVMDAAGIKKAALWGYKRGARLACIIAIEFQDRASAVLLGGSPRAIQLGVEPPPAQAPPWVEPMLRDDWPGFWSVYPMILTDDVKLRYQERNDLRALAAAMKGASRSKYMIDLRKVSVPAYVYSGGEDEPEAVALTAESLGVNVHVVDGHDHYTTFSDVDAVMPGAAEFLKTVDAK